MEIKKAEKLFKELEKKSRKISKRMDKNSCFKEIEKFLLEASFFSFFIFFILFMESGTYFELLPESMIFLKFFICLFLTCLLDYLIFIRRLLKVIKKRQNWWNKTDKIKEKRDLIKKELDDIILENIDIYFKEIENLEKEDKLNSLHNVLVDEVIKTKKEKLRKLSKRQSEIQEISNLEKEINAINNHSVLVND
ncbi:MAG: hypothetical protein CL760_01235 [Chloroflexi bacterium]|nr:hypothetical protein [Chloroflexota bacterium]|tara:strand:+ start:21949 stop:22530 length:582 start_codon:yes stop_codon:yes gene_type:complete